MNLSRQQFGRLTVLERAPNRGRQVRWRCRCECGEQPVVNAYLLRRGDTKSCGCLNAEARAARWRARFYATKHGLYGTPEYKALSNARQRCTIPTNPKFEHYGGRGIEYRLPLAIGEATALLIAAIGPRPAGMTLDRRDNDGHYEVGNLRWATRSEQLRNRRQPHRPGG
jgi:hypothetical protein